MLIEVLQLVFLKNKDAAKIVVGLAKVNTRIDQVIQFKQNKKYVKDLNE